MTTISLGFQLLAQSADAAPQKPQSMLYFITAGGTIGYVIIALSFVAVALAVVHLMQIREPALAPPKAVDDLEQLLSRGQVQQAVDYCEDAANACFLTRVMSAGLSRYRRSAFGALELKGALEEAGQEQVARLYRSTDAMALIAGIAPMLGLLGTVVGLNGAFSSISEAGGFARPDQLASDVSLALVTTIQGLVVAIPVSAMVTFFRNRIDGLAGNVASTIDGLAGHLEERAVPAASVRTASSGDAGAGAAR